MKYFALLTKLGENLLAQATALGTKLELTQMAVGDGGGSLPTPDTNQTKLIAEKRRAAINTLFIDDKNKNQIIAEQIIPEQDGGWWIREIGLFDKTGNLIAVANCPETYKPQLAEGSGRTQSIRMVLIVSHTESVTLKIDPSVVLATREYVNTEVTVIDKKIDALSAQTKLDLNKKFDKANISGQKGNDNDKVPSLHLFTTEIGKLAAIGYSYSKIESDGRYQPKGNYAPAGDYATNTALTNGLANKFDKTGGKLLGGIAATGISAEKIDSNHRVSIYPPTDDNESSLGYFQYNLGSSWFGRVLIPKAPQGQSISLLSTENIVQMAGNSTANIISQKGVTDLTNAKLDKSSVVQSVGTSETNVISQKALTNALIGFNQKFEDLKSQREKNVLYTNTTGKPIFITVSVLTTSVVTGIGITLYIDNVKFLTRGGGSANDGTYKGTSATAIIPPGSSYKIESNGEIDSWGELR
ncbi:phage tail protein [Providencia rettgeri]